MKLDVSIGEEEWRDVVNCEEKSAINEEDKPYWQIKSKSRKFARGRERKMKQREECVHKDR